MAIQTQLRRGTTAENDAFTGAIGELVYDTQKKQLRMQDGTTVGGIKVPLIGDFESTGITDDATATVLTLTAANNAEFSGDVSLVDGKNLNIGTDDDLVIGHDGFKGNLTNNTGLLLFLNKASDELIRFATSSGATTKTCIEMGGSATPSVSLFYDGLEKFKTTVEGVEATGDIIVGASQSIRLPNVADAGAHTYLYSDGTGSNRTFGIKYTSGGSPHFYLDATGNAIFSGNVSLAEDKRLHLGTGNALIIWHETDSLIRNTAGIFKVDQYVTSGETQFRSYDSADGIKTSMILGGATPFVRLYYDGAEKFKTTTGGAIVVGGNVAGVTLDIDNTSTSYRSEMYLSGNAPDADDVLYGIVWGRNKNNTAEKRIAAVQFKSSGATANNRGGKVVFTTKADGAANINTVATLDSGLVVGSPTGGDKGFGTINAEAVYDDNVLLSDYVFDFHLDGEINTDDAKQAEQFLANTSVLDLDSFTNHWKEHRHLPSLPSREEWEKDGAHSIGKLSQRLWETVELQAVHIDSLNMRLKKLEAL